MTTEASARLYEAQHMKDMEGRPIAVYNPHDKPFEELPVIYGFNNGGQVGWWQGLLMAEDGTLLGEHICTNECYMHHDLGILEGTKPDRHEDFRKHYPCGYRMEFVGLLYVRIHEKLMAAIAIRQSKDRLDRE